MYDYYYKGLIIREGTEGVSGGQLRSLYEAVGWCDAAFRRGRMKNLR